MKIRSLLVTLAFATSLDAQVLIDDFSSGEFMSGPTSPNFFTSTGTMLGSHRDSLVNGGDTTLVSVANGVLTVDAHPIGSYVGRWGQFDSDSSKNLHLDLGTGSLAIDVLSLSGPFDVLADIHSYNGNIANISSQLIHVSSPGLNYFMVSNFGGGANSSDVAGIFLGIPQNDTQPGTYVIDALETSAVPEPPSIAIVFGVALVGFAAARARRRIGRP